MAPNGPSSTSRLIMMLMSTPSATLITSPHTPSQYDECGAPMRISFGTFGSSPSSRQPLRRRITRASHGQNRLLRRGASGGVGGNIGAFIRSSTRANAFA